MKKASLIVLSLVCTVGSVLGDPITLKNGRIYEGKLENFRPATVEIVTQQGRTPIEVQELDRETLLKLLPDTAEAKAESNSASVGKQEAASSESAGKWIFSKMESPIDDSLTLIAQLPAEQTIERGLRKSAPFLVIRHKEGELEVYLTVGMFLGSEALTVTTRFDKLPARNARWSISSDKTAVFVSEPARFVKAALAAQRLVVRLTPYSESPVTCEFDLRGLAESAKPLLARVHLPAD